MVEFSRYGGIHKIDGRATGVLPAEIAPFGVGIARDDAERRRSRVRQRAPRSSSAARWTFASPLAGQTRPKAEDNRDERAPA